MFKKENEKGGLKEAETIIGSSVKVKGDFQGQGNIVVDGILEGGLKTLGSIYVGDKAKILGNIEGKDIRIGGEVNGNIKAAGILEINSTAKIKGDIEADNLSILKGAALNGKITMAVKNEERQK
jgi:cytoskeletal protein CcmA (bactofilin family)